MALNKKRRKQNKLIQFMRKMPAYYENGYFSLGMEYLKNHGIKETVHKAYQVAFGGNKKVLKDIPDYAKNSDLFHTNPIIAHHETVDIIICVHNALDDVKRCIDSVIKYSADPYHIIIVNDGSNEETEEYLKTVAEKYSFDNRVTLLKNEGSSHGYAIAANIGMHSSSGEYVILLNSDTIVTSRWLDKMIDCAKSDSKIGVVGPLSNTASWQSVPKLTENGDWCHNELPEDIDVEEMGELIERYSGRIYMQVPLINGFCMMISRKVLDTIGYFDEENFGRGFGEEDDFNLRAYKAGFKLAIADNTYIYHAQSKSYTDSVRLELSRRSGEILRQKHGADNIEKCVFYMRDNLVLLGVRERVAAAIDRRNYLRDIQKKWEGKRILFHLPCGEAGGGANVIIQECRQLIRMGVDVAFYNIEMYQDSFEQGYPDLEIPVYYGIGYNGFLKYAYKFDVVCMTYCKAVKYAEDLVNDKNEKIKYAYYIQDFEPYFFEEGSKAYKEALSSYTEKKDMICLTKTKWNYNVVREKTGRECTVLGPSVNIDLFRPRRAFSSTGKVKIAAMIRPSSPRRAPELTMKVLEKLWNQYQACVEVTIFGCDQEEYAEFFEKTSVDFVYENLGKITPLQMAEVLSKNDIFVDYSEFQAMGLTAMEAMASGCAVVLPKYGGTSDFARHETNCLVVDTKDMDECIYQTARLIEDGGLRYDLSCQAVKDMCKYYPEKCSMRFIERIFA